MCTALKKMKYQEKINNKNGKEEITFRFVSLGKIASMPRICFLFLFCFFQVDVSKSLKPVVEMGCYEIIINENEN